jgi:hypothetical protein
MTMPRSSGPEAGPRLAAEQRVPRARRGGPDIAHPATATTTTNRAATNRATTNSGDVEAVAAALAAAIGDGDRIQDLLDVLSNGRIWVPLPDDGRPVTDGSSPRPSTPGPDRHPAGPRRPVP